MGRGPRFVVGGIIILAVVTGCTTPGEQSRGPGVPTETVDGPPVEGVELVEVASGLEQPVLVAHAGDGSGRFFVVEQSGVVRIVDAGAVRPTPFLDIATLVEAGGEQGLLGLAFPPDYEKSGRFYVSYTAEEGNGDSRLVRYKVSATDANVADATSGEVLLTVNQPYANHNGGNIVFGPDGYLYFGLGDGGSGGDPHGNGQSLGTLLGKLLRIDVSDATGYTIPPTNPFVSNLAAKHEIWSYGLRNPWRFTFDRANGDLYIGDVGQNAWEEIDFQPASSNGGENYGWNLYEGSHAYKVGLPASTVFPVAEHAHGGGECSITGGHVYRGKNVASLSGVYVYGDYCSGRIWTLKKTAAAWENALLFDTDHNISSFGEDEAGEVYVVDHGGAIYRFAPRGVTGS
jgi:glucose/arabinose dehydrogenase